VFVPSLADDDGTTRSLVEAEGVRYEFMEADITGDRCAGQVVQECVDRLGSIDVLINSAGICPLAEVLEFGRDSGTPRWRSTSPPRSR
jgi:NAD(P)-dependent dehydrogenase (short-subunit alcohol dehydrogenase family)